MKICSTSEFPSRTSFIKPLTKELTMYKTVLSRLQIGSSNTKILRLETFDISTEPLANCKKYKNDIEGFVNFICTSGFSVDGDYKESWVYIEKGMNSLERHTNLNICIKEEFNKENVDI